MKMVQRFGAFFHLPIKSFNSLDVIGNKKTLSSLPAMNGNEENKKDGYNVPKEVS